MTRVTRSTENLQLPRQFRGALVVPAALAPEETRRRLFYRFGNFHPPHLHRSCESTAEEHLLPKTTRELLLIRVVMSVRRMRSNIESCPPFLIVRQVLGSATGHPATISASLNHNLNE